MSRKVGLVISLVLALLFTLLIVGVANRKYSQATETVEALRAKEFIPAGVEVSEKNVEVVKVFKTAAEGLVSPQEAMGKAAKVSMVKGQYVYREALDVAGQLKPGHVEVLIPVDLSSSASALPGQLVNVHLVSKEGGKAPIVLENIRVTRCLDSQGKEVGSGSAPLDVAGGGGPAAVGLEVPKDKAEAVVAAAAAKQVYLTKCGPQ